MNKADYVNGITVTSLLCITPDNFDEQRALYCFTSIASINHIISEQFRNNKLIKPVFDELILSSGILKKIVIINDVISVNDKSIDNISGSIRQFIICKNTIKLFYDKPLLIMFSLICKIIYLYERTTRIEKNKRNHFELLHCIEHIDLLLYLFYKLKHDKQQTIIKLMVYFLTTGIIIPSVVFKFVNMYLYYNYKSRLPKWFDNSLLPFFEKKITGNYKSNNIPNYLIKIFSPKLNWDFMSWVIIEKKIQILHEKIKQDNFKPDICIGILSGGAFCLKYLSSLFNIEEIFYIKCIQWSNVNVKRQTIQTFDYLTKTHNKYVNHNKNEIHEISNDLDTYITNTKTPLNILLFDDTVSTGKSIYNVKKYLQEKTYKLNNVNIKTACIITNCENNVDYKVDTSTINVMWEWGVELD